MVRIGMRAEEYVPGQQVLVPWGLEVLSGMVVEIRGAGWKRRVRVSVELPDTGGATEILHYSPAELAAAAAEASWRQPGWWLTPRKYVESVQRSVNSLLLTDFMNSVESVAQFVEGSPADLSLAIGSREIRIGVQDPPSGEVGPEAVERLLSCAPADGSRNSALLLVSSAPLSREAHAGIERATAEGRLVRAVEWKSREDDAALGHALSELTEVRPSGRSAA